MNVRRIAVVVAMLALCFSVPSFGADDKPPQDPQTNGNNAGRPGRGRGGMAGAMMPGGEFNQMVAALGELNLSPDFTLTADQKQKIQTVRDDVKQKMEQWRKDKADDFKSLEEKAADLRSNRGQGNNREAMQALMKDRQTLMASAPSTDDAVKQLKAVLTDDQQKKLDDKITELKQQRANMPGFGRGGPGGARGGNAGGANQ